jgi:hypothetical protein
VINSYLGLMGNFDSYKLRKKMLLRCNSTNIQNGFIVDGAISRVKINK